MLQNLFHSETATILLCLAETGHLGFLDLLNTRVVCRSWLASSEGAFRASALNRLFETDSCWSYQIKSEGDPHYRILVPEDLQWMSSAKTAAQHLLSLDIRRCYYSPTTPIYHYDDSEEGI